MAEKLLGGFYHDVRPLGVFLSDALGSNRVSAALQELLDSVVVAKRRACLYATLPALVLDDALQTLALLQRVIRRNLSAGCRCVLSKGHKLGYETLRTASDTDTSITAGIGATHKDQFLTRPWSELRTLAGMKRFTALLSDPTLALYRQLPNNCLLQLTGVALDDDMRELLVASKAAPAAARPARAQRSEPPTKEPCPDKEYPVDGRPSLDSPCVATPLTSAAVANSSQFPSLRLKGTWHLPRGDLRASGGAKGRWLLYCRPLFHQAYIRGRGMEILPPDHVLETCAVVRHDALSFSAATSSASSGHLSSASSRGSQNVSVQASVNFNAVTGNSARRLVRHIFLEAPHIVDLHIFNGLPLLPDVQTASHNSNAGYVPDVSPAQVPVPAVNRPASEGYAPGSSSFTDVQLTSSTSTTTRSGADIPNGLLRAVPFFLEMLRRHVCNVDYARLLERHCPRRDSTHRGFRQKAPAAAKDSISSTVAVLSFSATSDVGSKRLRIPESASTDGSRVKRIRFADEISAGVGSSTVLPPADNASASSSSSSPLPTVLPSSTASEPPDDLSSPLALVTPAHDVMNFLRAALFALLPAQLWGNADCKRHLLRLVWKWVNMGRRDRATVQDVTHGLPTSPFSPVFGTNPSSCAQRVYCWVTWLLLGFVSPLLSGAFYITQSEATHQQPLYYRKPTWARLTRRALSKLRSSLQLTVLGEASGGGSIGSAVASTSSYSFASAYVQTAPPSSASTSLPSALMFSTSMSSSTQLNAPSSEHSSSGTLSNLGVPRQYGAGPLQPLGVVPMRLVPKSKGLRPIMNLSAGQTGMRLALVTAAQGAGDASSRSKRIGPPSDPSPSISSAVALQSIDNASRPSSGGLHGAGSTSLLSSTTLPFARSINKQLESAHEVLKLMRHDMPGVVGAAVFGLDGMFAAMRRFALLRQAAAVRASANSYVNSSASAACDTAPATLPPLHVISWDVSSAYDSILHEKLRGVIRGLLPAANTAFEVRSYARISPVSGDPSQDWAEDGSVVTSRVRYRRAAVRVADRQPFYVQARFLALETHDVVFIDSGGATQISSEEVAALLQRHVESHIIRLPSGVTCVQGVGIPQGSIVSSMLCNTYFGIMETGEVIPAAFREVGLSGAGTAPVAASATSGWDAGFAQAAGGEADSAAARTSPASVSSVLMRLTDDFVLLTESHQVATAFARVAHRGVPSYNCVVTPVKTESSFVATVPGPGGASVDIAPVPPGAPVSWCGFRIHPSTGAVTADYDRYRGPGRVAAALTLNFTPTVGEGLARAVRASLRPKCHPLLLDGVVNTLPVVALNLYQICLLTGAKLLVLLRRVPGGCPSREFLVRLLQQGMAYTVALVRKRCPVRARPGNAAQSASARTSQDSAAPPSVSSHPDEAPPASGYSSRASSLSRDPQPPVRTGDTLLLGTTSTVHVLRGPDGAYSCSITSPPAAMGSPPMQLSWCPLRTCEIKWLFLTAMARIFGRAGPDLSSVQGAMLRLRGFVSVRPASTPGVRQPAVPLGSSSLASGTGTGTGSMRSSMLPSESLGRTTDAPAGGPRHGRPSASAPSASAAGCASAAASHSLPVRAVVRAQAEDAHSPFLADLDLC